MHHTIESSCIKILKRGRTNIFNFFFLIISFIFKSACIEPSVCQSCSPGTEKLNDTWDLPSSHFQMLLLRIPLKELPFT